MVSLEEYAFLSDLVYNGKRTDENDLNIGLLDGWTQKKYISDDHKNPTNENKTEFAAGVYQKGDDIVIAFCGTNENIEFLDPDILSGLGILNEQITEALKLTIDTINENPGKNITFIGHSLGGGLASVMSVYFDIKSTVFNEAPFELSTSAPTVRSFVEQVLTKELGYTKDQIPKALWDYYSSFDNDTNSVLYGKRERNITHYHIEGEILEKIRFDWNTIAGTDYAVNLGEQSASGSSLHLMPLFTAIIFSETFKTAVTKHKLSAEVFYDESLYGYSYKTSDKVHFLIKMIKQHLAEENRDKDWLKQLATDMNKIVDADTSNDDRVVKGLLAALTEYWYFNTDANNTAFNVLEGGVQVDFSKFVTNADGKGRDRLNQMLTDDIHYSLLSFEVNRKGLSKEALRSIGRLLEPFDLSSTGLYNIGHYQRDLSVDSSANSQNTLVYAYDASSVYAKTGAGDDTLIGSADGSNTLYGEAGNDLIISFGNGRNVLNGGEGQDTIYAYGTNAEINGGIGNDTIYSYADNAKLDGGTGNYNDVLASYGEHSTLIGGEGDDTLKSYAVGELAKADTLEGGKGIDKYYVDKADTIKDEDGLGSVFLSEKLLTGGIRDEKDTTTLRSARCLF